MFVVVDRPGHGRAPAGSPMKIEQRSPDSLTPYPDNPRDIPPNAIAAVAESIRRYGFQQPIVTDQDGVIIVGHTRLYAAQKLGLTEVPVVVADLPPDEARAYRLADNRTNQNAAWDQSALVEEIEALTANLAADIPTLAQMTAFTEAELKRLLAANAPDEAPLTAEPETRAKPGDLWQLGAHRLLCGDATDETQVARLLDGDGVDCILTDPPYSSGGFQEAGRSAGSKGTAADYTPLTNDRLSTRGYMALMKQVLGKVSVQVIYVFTDWRMWISAFDVAEGSGYGVRSMIVWDKGTPGMGQGWRTQHELILCGTKANGLWRRHLGGQGNVVTFARVSNVHHATQKPVELLDTILKTTPFADSVYDPFVGSGTTVIAAERQSRVCYAIEIEPRYADHCLARWEQYTGETAELL